MNNNDPIESAVRALRQGQVGLRVRIKQIQQRLGKPCYPGRIGHLVRQNNCTLFDHPQNALWYVNLDPTPRAQARQVTVWARDMEALPDDEPGGNTEDPATDKRQNVMDRAE